MDDCVSVIPAELRSDLEALRPVLERQGVVQYRRSADRPGSYRLRFREFSKSAGFTLHRSFALGDDPVVAEAVAALVQQWQDEHVAVRKAVAPPPESPKPEAPPSDLAREVAQLLAGGGWRRKEQIGEWYDQALKDPTEILRFSMTGRFPPARKAGRPPKKRLW
ncbi:MAG: hypothetical protein WCT04_09665 [Planctomycetota bacterium]